MKYQHLFFDLDHTLWDFEKNAQIAMHLAFEKLDIGTFLNCTSDEFYEIYTPINLKFWERFRKGFINRETLRWKRIDVSFRTFKKSNEALTKALGDLYLEYLPLQKNLFDDAENVLQYCKQKGYKMHLITNGFDGTQKLKLQHSGIAHYFQEMISSERAMSMKPQAEIFYYALETTRAKKEKSIMIGDHFEVDIEGAKKIGMDQIYFNPEKKVGHGHCTFEINTLSELLNIF